MARYYIEVSNAYLGKHRRVTGSTRREAEARAQSQLEQWLLQERRARERAAIADANARAAAMTADAERRRVEYRTILAESLKHEHRLDWDRASFLDPFDEPEPSLSSIISERGVPGATPFLEFLRLKSKQTREQAEAAANSAYRSALQQWREAHTRHEEVAREHTAEIERVRRGYEARDADSIAAYVALVLSESIYPDEFPDEITVFCGEADTSTVIVELEMPRFDDIPKTIAFRFDSRRNEIIPHLLAQSAVAELYDGVVYQTALRTLHEVFSGDYVGVVQKATLNLLTMKINPATGADEHICVATCEVERDQFATFDISRVEPRECFRALKGLTAKRPSALVHVQPLRVIEARADEGGLAMEVAVEQKPTPDLLDIDPFAFEELIGSLFERVFARENAAVQVTKASHDGGVDVVVVDPDEIKGGKIVIQVKRYRGVVAPAYVRDLYGTMLNEGAAKGILVATGHFGPEARAFAQDKPITLIDADGLLKMLAEHGYRYRLAD